MSVRPFIKQFAAINAQSMGANITSTASVIDNLTMMSYQVSWTGTAPVGTLAVQVSNDFKLSSDGKTAAVAGTWTTIVFEYNGSLVSSVPVTGNAGDGFFDIDAIGAYAIRLVYTRTSGTGTLNAIFNAKVA